MTTQGSRRILTDVVFLDPINRRKIKGELHQLLDILILDAKKGEWENAVDRPLLATDMAVQCAVFYEKNGQVVFPLGACEFNLAANMMLNKLMQLEQSAEAPAIEVPPINGSVH